MDESSNTAANVSRAISVSLDWNSSPDARNGAAAYLESVKSGDIRVLANTSLLLVRRDCSSEIRLHGFKMLQHLVRFRWDEFSIVERKDFANVAINLISEMANPREEWALKSQTAVLVAEVIRREGVTLWHELLPSLVSLSNKGPIEAELIAVMLRWLPEDITVHNEDLEGDRRRVLLRGLTESLTDIFPLLYSLLEKNFGAALSEYGRQQLDIAKQHVATVTATLNAVNAYAEWAPVSDLSKYGLVKGCGFLLSSPEFRLHACDFFRLVSQRKRPVDASASDFDSAMSNIFKILMNVSGDFLNRTDSISAIDEIEFVESICESMVALGSYHMQCIARDASITCIYLQQMLGYFQHFKFVLHFQSLNFWLVLVRESVSKAKTGAPEPIMEDNSAVVDFGNGSGHADKEKKGVSIFVNDEIRAAIMDVSLQRMLKKSITPGATVVEALELWSEEFDGRIGFGQYRAKLLDLIRLVASQRPVVAAARVSHRVDTITKSFVYSPPSTQDLALMEGAQLCLETVVSAIFDGPAECVGGNSEIKFQLHRILEGLLQHLLTLKWVEPALAEILGRYLDALGPYLRYFPDSVTGVINKLFELLTSLPISHKDPSSSTSRLARLQICSSFIRIARAADKSLFPHMKGIADTMAYLQGEGRLLRGEHNLLGEAFLVMVASAGIQQQQEVLAWLLEPLSKQWTQLEWQNAYLSDPLGLTRLCSDRQFMWSIFHTVTFFEKALKRSGVKKTNLNLQGCSPSSDLSTYSHPMSSHLSWMLPPLLRLLRSVHSLWSRPIDQALTGELRAAKSMSHVEQASLLGESYFKMPKGQLAVADGSLIDMNKEDESIENDIRNWLKGVRDSGYNVLGLSTTIGDSFFRSLDSSLVALVLMENLQSMEFRHLRRLIHSVVVPLVKSCPPDLRGSWLENLLDPLFLYCQQALTCSWSSLLTEGRAKVPDTFPNVSGLELKVEVMEEKLLRDLTREICSLLSVIASSDLNTSLPSMELLTHPSRRNPSLQDLDSLAPNSLIAFLLKHKGHSFPAVRISIEAFGWPDVESLAKVIPFSEAVILLAISTNDKQLREFVSKDLFCAIIQSLAPESNVNISSDLVGLCRDVFIHMPDPAPRQVLLSLPCITNNDLVAFEDALSKTTSLKEQKQHMKSLLQLATGNKLKALSVQKTLNVITNVTARTRTSALPSIEEDDEAVGLAAITQHTH